MEEVDTACHFSGVLFCAVLASGRRGRAPQPVVWGRVTGQASDPGLADQQSECAVRPAAPCPSGPHEARKPPPPWSRGHGVPLFWLLGQGGAKPLRGNQVGTMAR